MEIAAHATTAAPEGCELFCPGRSLKGLDGSFIAAAVLCSFLQHVQERHLARQAPLSNRLLIPSR